MFPCQKPYMYIYVYAYMYKACTYNVHCTYIPAFPLTLYM